MKTTMLRCSVMLLLLPTTSLQAETINLPLSAKGPGAVIYDKGGIDGPEAFAKGKVTREEAARWCSNWAAGEDQRKCVGNLLEEYKGQDFIARADCTKGAITAVDKERYELAGVWQGGIGHGRTKWRRSSTGEIVGISNAEGGLGIARQWEILCPHGLRRLPDTTKMVLEPDDYSGSQSMWNHNGSIMYVDRVNGVISYGSPKDALAGTIAPHTVLFRGTIPEKGKVEGTAYTFKKGCSPAPYKVTGFFDGSGDSFVLKGKAPVRNGCEISGYSESGPNSVLKFENAMSY